MSPKYCTECITASAVRKMHEHFDLVYDGPPRNLDPEEKAFRIAAMQEELDEFKASIDLVDEYDAMLDLLVFTIGTLDRMGLPVFQGFRAVMDCNMQKTVGPNSKRGGFSRDLVKPEGFEGPEAALELIIHDATVWANGEKA